MNVDDRRWRDQVTHDLQTLGANQKTLHREIRAVTKKLDDIERKINGIIGVLNSLPR